MKALVITVALTGGYFAFPSLPAIAADMTSRAMNLATEAELLIESGNCADATLPQSPEKCVQADRDLKELHKLGWCGGGVRGPSEGWHHCGR